jgi:hypothetical protein
VRDSELQPAHDVRVLDVVVAIGPVDDGFVVGPARLAIRLADVVASGEELVFAVLGHPQAFTGEAGTAPDETAWSAEQAGGFAADDFVAYGFFAGGVELVGVDDVPGAAGFVVVITSALFAWLPACPTGMSVLTASFCTTELFGPSMAGSTRRENRCWWLWALSPSAT